MSAAVLPGFSAANFKTTGASCSRIFSSAVAVLSSMPERSEVPLTLEVATGSKPGSVRIFAAVAFWSGRPSMSFTDVVMTTA